MDINEMEQTYRSRYEHAATDRVSFWADQATRRLTWASPWTAPYQGSLSEGSSRWFVNGQLNACYNCVDRHLKTKANQIAFLWEGNEPSEHQAITYQALHEKIGQLANAFKKLGLQKGDRVCIYLPMIPEAIFAMLACARIGAIHTVVFAGFSAEALKTRIHDAQCKLVVTADGSMRGNKLTPLKQNVDDAIQDCPSVMHVIVVQQTNTTPTTWRASRDIWYHTATESMSTVCPPEPMDANDPLFILYTSGSTGKPKGILHATGGYLVYVAATFADVFDYRDDDIYWCSADVGWITGHSYLVYGPLLNGATSVLFEGVPQYPTVSRYWDIIDKYQVSIFYTSPTALRALRREGDDWVHQSSRDSLRILGSVGEPINPDVWAWFYEVIGKRRCPISNTWWQTETGGIMISPFPHQTDCAPGSAGEPFFGIIPDVVDDSGQPVPLGQSGKLVIKHPWPGMMQTIYGDQARFMSSYLTEIPGCYTTGDGAYRDARGHIWITGRNDDVIKVSGHRIGTEELESAFLSHTSVAEAAVVGAPHPVKGESIYAFITTKIDFIPTDKLKKDLIQHVRTQIGPLATPETIQWANTGLPKTRSGKIMRRILRKIANNEFDNIGDISTLADTEVVATLIKEKQ